MKEGGRRACRWENGPSPQTSQEGKRATTSLSLAMLTTTNSTDASSYIDINACLAFRSQQ